MAQFDPAAATAAYLATLPPEVHARAHDYTVGDHWLLLWNAVVSVAIAWFVIRSGLLVGVRSRIESDRPRPWLTAATLTVVYLIAEAVLSLPWNIYSDWWRNTQYGLTSQPLSGWLSDALKGAIISVLLTTVLASVVYALMRKAKQLWWLWGGAVTALFMMALLIAAPTVLMPLFNKYTPAPPGPMRDAVVQMAQANGVPSDKIFIYNGSKQSNAYTANVAGLFGTARVAMSDTMFAKGADVPEVRAVVGHEMGHYVLHHVLWSAFGMGALTLLGFFMVDRLFPTIRVLTRAKGVGVIADPAGMPIIGMILTVLSLIATPLQNWVSRSMEAAADRFSLERVNEPDGLARALVKTIEYRAATPTPLEEAIFYSHPSVGSRVRRAMEWKAAHMPPEPKPAAAPASPPTP